MHQGCYSYMKPICLIAGIYCEKNIFQIKRFAFRCDLAIKYMEDTWIQKYASFNFCQITEFAELN